MIGAIIGDIAGSVYEFGGIKTKDFPLFGDHGGQKCRFTDDSAMTLAAAGALLETAAEGSDLSANAVSWMQRVGRAHRDAGYGGSFLRWLFSDEPKPYNSYGNGSAMRVSPAAWAAGSLEEALKNADAVTAVTHDHPEGLKGARAVAACIYLARSGADKAAIRDYVREHYYPLDRTLAEIRPGYRFEVSCQKSVPEAIQAFLEAESFEDAVRGAISLGGDSDTQAAIAGSIAGPCFGIPGELRQRALGFLPEDLKELLFAFEGRFGANRTAE
jgi:type I restriction enzyme M protein